MRETLKVAVLMGGPSEEHDVSLKSGQGVVRALTKRRWAVEPVVIPKALTVHGASEFARRALQQVCADVAFIALHGIFGEDGTIQQLCEDVRLAYTGSDVPASRLGIDKSASRKRFEDAGLSVPRWEAVEFAAGRVPQRPRGVSYPLVVKPNGQGSSLGISIIRQEEELSAALAEASRYGSQVLLEEFVSGRELTVGILGDEPLPVIEIRPSHPFFDYTAKYTAGLTEYVVPAPLAPPVAKAVQAAALTAHRALGCRHLSRADLILTRGNVPVLLEVNTIPGFTPTSLLPKAAACVNLSYEELCEQVVLMAWQGSLSLVRSS
jgi:D-alanine-D-alanine ligase